MFLNCQEGVKRGEGGTPRSRSTKSGWLLQLIFFYPPPPAVRFPTTTCKFFQIIYNFSKFSVAHLPDTSFNIFSQNFVIHDLKCTCFQPGQLRSKLMWLEGFRPSTVLMTNRERGAREQVLGKCPSQRKILKNCI